MKNNGSTTGLGTLLLIVLMLAFLLASAAIFFFGLILGQEMAMRRAAEGEHVVRASAPQPAPTATPVVGVDPSFYKDMQDKAYANLADQEPTAASTPQIALPIATFTPARATATAARPTATRSTATKTPAPTKPAPVRTPTVAPREPASTSEKTSGHWTVRVGATSNSQQALNAIVDLRKQGFQAYTAEAPGSDGQTVYEVRVGRFTNRDEAKAVEEKLKANPRYKNATISGQ